MSSPDEPVDDGWEEGPDDGGDAGGDAADGGAAAAGGAPGDASGAPRKRRRRRRRREGGEASGSQPQGASASPSQAPATGAPEQQRTTRQYSDRMQPAGSDGGDSSATSGSGSGGSSATSGGGSGGSERRDARGGGDQRARRESRGGDQQRGGGGDRGPRQSGDQQRGGGEQQRGGAGDRGPRQGGDQQRGGGEQQRSGGGDPQARGGDQQRGGGGDRGPRQGGRDARGGDRGGQQGGGRDRGGDRGQGGRGGDRGRGGDQQRGGDRFRDQRGRENRLDPGQEADLRTDADDVLRGDPYRDGGDGKPEAAAPSQSAAHGRSGSASTAPATATHDDEEHAAPATVSYGSDDDSPAPTIALAPDLPVEAPSTDPDPVTFPLVDGPGAQLGDDVASVVGVRYVTAGRIQWCDAGDGDYALGQRVMVDADRGPRLAWIAVSATRRATRDRGLRRVIRRANDQDLRGERDGEAGQVQALRVAKDKAAALRLPLKVYRVEKLGNKLNVYYTSDEQRLDLRDFVRDVGQATGLRLELRQLGVRDEAKAVGGIGSCGLTLCCTTWLPDFVPVSIKMAKDQGLVLSPSKVSGQCGRLKCCLVYEQAGYAEMRKGLPKLGKRVVSPRGEGRVVEVDVLRQRIRVSYGAGDTEVLPATEVKPMFPSGNQPREPEHDHDADEPHTPDLPES